MKIVEWRVLIDRGPEGWDDVRDRVFSDVRQAILRVQWPPKSGSFTIYPQSGKKRGEGNGVKPIKSAFVAALEDRGWKAEYPFPISEGLRSPGKIDVGLDLASEGLRPFVAEWETGNVSSSHRAMNKMVIGLMRETLTGGVLVLPTRKLYRYLTDRIGNFKEIEPYFPIWSRPDVTGYLAVVAVEHDDESLDVPRIGKGTDGRALV